MREIHDDTFANYLRFIRKRAKISSKKLARMLGKGDAYISQIENGRNKKPDYNTAFKLLKILKVDKDKIESILASFEILSPEKNIEKEETEESYWKDITKYYVYRFKNINSDIIYVGKTKTNINNRMSQHFGSYGHLPKECYDQVESVEYLEIKNKIEMDIKELYYINKWKPFYNTQNKYEDELTLSIDDNDKWVLFKLRNDNYINDLEIENSQLKNEINKYKEELNFYREYYHSLRNHG